jgi:hypothetical protein
LAVLLVLAGLYLVVLTPHRDAAIVPILSGVFLIALARTSDWGKIHFGPNGFDIVRRRRQPTTRRTSRSERTGKGKT